MLTDKELITFASIVNKEPKQAFLFGQYLASMERNKQIVISNRGKSQDELKALVDTITQNDVDNFKKQYPEYAEQLPDNTGI